MLFVPAHCDLTEENEKTLKKKRKIMKMKEKTLHLNANFI